MASKMNVCIVGIGSNIDPEQHIESALTILRQGVAVKGVSTWVKTKPIGFSGQNDFINGAVKVQTAMSRTTFKKYLKNLENRLGRDRSLPKFGPRVIDLDIIVWNSKIVDDDYYTRDFVKHSVDELNITSSDKT